MRKEGRTYRGDQGGGPGERHDPSYGRRGGHAFDDRLGDGDALLAAAQQHEEQPHQGAVFGSARGRAGDWVGWGRVDATAAWKNLKS